MIIKKVAKVWPRFGQVPGTIQPYIKLAETLLTSTKPKTLHKKKTWYATTTKKRAPPIQCLHRSFHNQLAHNHG